MNATLNTRAQWAQGLQLLAQVKGESWDQGYAAITLEGSDGSWALDLIPLINCDSCGCVLHGPNPVRLVFPSKPDLLGFMKFARISSHRLQDSYPPEHDIDEDSGSVLCEECMAEVTSDRYSA
jgi:hypothetical protein